MQRVIFVTFSFLVSNFIFSQPGSNHIELHPYLQWDNYPSFTIPFNSVTNSTIKAKGTSWGIGVNYKHAYKKNLFTKIGLGYYKYYFNKIQRHTRPFGSSHTREINYPGGSSTFSYVCDKYWYNTITGTIGFEKLFALKRDLDFIAGGELINYYTFSQRYNIPGTNNDSKYKRTNGRYFGFSFNLSAGLQKNLGRITIGPAISLPIFRNWKQDIVFPGEQNNKSRSKWLRGVAAGITFLYPLTKI